MPSQPQKKLLARVGKLLRHRDPAIRNVAVSEFVALGAAALAPLSQVAQRTAPQHVAKDLQDILSFVGTLVRDRRWGARRCASLILEQFAAQHAAWNAALVDGFLAMTAAGGEPRTGLLRALNLDMLVERGLPLLAQSVEDARSHEQRALAGVANEDSAAVFAAQRDAIMNVMVSGAGDGEATISDDEVSTGAVEQSKHFLAGVVAPRDLRAATALSDGAQRLVPAAEFVRGAARSAPSLSSLSSSSPTSASCIHSGQPSDAAGVATLDAGSAVDVGKPPDPRTQLLVQFCTALRGDLLAAEWHIRHGCANALLAILSALPALDERRSRFFHPPNLRTASAAASAAAVAGMTAGGPPVKVGAEVGLGVGGTQWLEDCVVRCVCVLGLDHFGDYAGESTVRPAAEAAAQLLGVVVALLGRRCAP